VIGQYEVDTPEGKKRKYVSGRTKKEVARKLAKAIADSESGLVRDSGTLSLGDYLVRWVDNLKDSIRQSTWRRHEVNVRTHLKPTLGHVKLDKLTPLQVQSVYRHKLDEGLSAATVVKIHSTLSKSLKLAVKWQLVKNNVCTAVDPPRPTKPEIKPLTTSQLQAMLDAARNDALYPLYVLAATTGMRIGEILGLKWEDVNLEAGTLQVKRSVFNDQISQPKTASGRRTIRLSKLAIRALKEHEQECEWLFCTSKGTTINVNNLRYRSWKRLLGKAGLPSTTRIHDLRHSAATLLLGKSVPVKVVSEMLGHADPSITLSVYAHVLPDMQGGAADAMDDALS
jgi:integrase